LLSKNLLADLYALSEIDEKPYLNAGGLRVIYGLGEDPHLFFLIVPFRICHHLVNRFHEDGRIHQHPFEDVIKRIGFVFMRNFMAKF